MVQNYSWADIQLKWYMDASSTDIYIYFSDINWDNKIPSMPRIKANVPHNRVV